MVGRGRKSFHFQFFFQFNTKIHKSENAYTRGYCESFLSEKTNDDIELEDSELQLKLFKDKEIQ